MQTKTQPYKFDKLYERIENSRSGEPKIRGKNVTARITGTHITGNRAITIRHYNTDIAVIEEYSKDGTLYLWIDTNGFCRSGGGFWEDRPSGMTKHYLNEIFRAYNVDTRIFQKDFVWYFHDQNGTFDYFDGAAFWGSK